MPQGAAGRNMRRLDRIEQAVLAVATVAVLARVAGLGARPFHWDEARVGYWTLRSLETGAYEYRPVAGGPFLYVLGRWLFGLGATSDAAARLPVALIGGLLPAAALLFRRATLVTDVERNRLPSVGLSDAETVTLALLLAAAPPLLYYSRVLRGELPLVTFGLLTIGFAWHAWLRRSHRALYAAAATFGLALTTSAFVFAMLVCWLFAAALTVDESRIRDADVATLHQRVRATLSGLSNWTPELLRGTVVAVAVTLFFYVPRGRIELSKPASVFRTLDAGTLGVFESFLAVRVFGRHAPPTHVNDHPLLPFVVGNAEVLLATALPVVALALWGFFRERYAGRTRPAVAFATYWAGAGLLVFPLATEVNQPWVAVHVLAPATLPAAVGLAALWTTARESVVAGDAARVAAALLLLSAAGVHTGAVVADEVYDEPEVGDSLPGYAQPDAELRPVVTAIERAISGNTGTDVLYVGAGLAVKDEATLDRPPIPEANRAAFSTRLPLSWYVERADARTASVEAPAAMAESAPPVVVTTSRHRAILSDRLAGYERYEVDLGLPGRTLVVFVDR